LDRVHFRTDSLAEGDEDFLRVATAFHNQENGLPDWPDVLDDADFLLPFRNDGATDQPEGFATPFPGRPETVFLNEKARSGQSFRLGQRIYTFELKDVKTFKGIKGLNLVLLEVPSSFQKNFKKKVSGRISPYSFTLSSPLFPWLRWTFPMLCKSTFLDDLEVESPFQLHASGTEDDADGPSRSALLSDHFSQIFLRNLQFQNRRLFPFELGNLHLLRLVDEGFGNQFYELFHSNLL
jgi:hypothetical protein